MNQQVKYFGISLCGCLLMAYVMYHQLNYPAARK
nr:MAG TPA: hypothetical protein [Caudoviricetes sp.]